MKHAFLVVAIVYVFAVFLSAYLIQIIFPDEFEGRFLIPFSVGIIIMLLTIMLYERLKANQ